MGTIEINLETIPMLPKVILNHLRESSFCLFSANDNDMVMDEGMSFTIGKLLYLFYFCFNIKIPLCINVVLTPLFLFRAHTDGGLFRVQDPEGQVDRSVYRQ